MKLLIMQFPRAPCSLCPLGQPQWNWVPLKYEKQQLLPKQQGRGEGVLLVMTPSHARLT
jgi:hypothetical protein